MSAHTNNGTALQPFDTGLEDLVQAAGLSLEPTALNLDWSSIRTVLPPTDQVQDKCTKDSVADPVAELDE